MSPEVKRVLNYIMASSRNKEIPWKNVDFIRDSITINFYNIRAVLTKKKIYVWLSKIILILRTGIKLKITYFKCWVGRYKYVWKKKVGYTSHHG